MKARSVRQLALIMCAVAAVVLPGCGGGGGDPFTGAPLRYDPGIPIQVTGLEAVSGDQVVSLKWTSSYSAYAYNIYYTASPEGVTATNSVKVRVTTNSYPIWGLTNGVTYYFRITAENADGEGEPSAQVSCAPGPITQADLTGTWHFSTLVSGGTAKWERGTLVIDGSGNATFTDFLDSDHYDAASDTSTAVALPPDITVTVQGDGSLKINGGVAPWGDFHATMGSRKNMWVGTRTYSVDSMALTVFQKARTVNDYNVWDIAGTSSDQNPNNPELAGNGPTRFSWHSLNSGTSLEWEYSNARVGQQAQFWVSPPVSDFIPDTPTGTLNSIKDVIYWDYSTPSYKIVEGYDLLWKVTCFAVRSDGMLKEYDSYAAVKDGYHNVVFTGRMTNDKTVVVGVSTKNAIDMSQASTGSIITVPGRYYLRILQLNFVPTDQSLPTYTLDDLAGTYKFHKLGARTNAGSTLASWAWGRMRVATSGLTTFPQYADSDSMLSSPDSFVFSYYPDTGSDGHTFSTFANFVSPNTGAAGSRYYTAAQPNLTLWTWWNALTTMTQSGSGVRQIMPSPYYFNEHATLSYNRDMVVVTRDDSFGHSMIIGLK